MTIATAPPSRPLGPWANGMAMSEEEFDSATDFDPNYRYELVHGVLVVSPPPEIGERGRNDELAFLLRHYQYNHPQGSRIDCTVPEQTIITSAGRRRADRVIWIGLGRRPDPVADTPAIVIELVSDSTRDRKRDYETKRLEYLAAGVKEYWVIDRFRRTMTVCMADRVSTLAAHETYRTELLPGFELPLLRVLDAPDGPQVP
jgi:Uma2 family endonuclease